VITIHNEILIFGKKEEFLNVPVNVMWFCQKFEYNEIGVCNRKGYC
jgi:hypothetical protein